MASISSVFYLLYYNQAFEEGRCVDVIPEDAFAIVRIHQSSLLISNDSVLESALSELPAFKSFFDEVNCWGRHQMPLASHLTDRTFYHYFFTLNDSVVNAWCFDCVNQQEALSVKRWMKGHASKVKVDGMSDAAIYCTDSLWYVAVKDGRVVISQFLHALKASFGQVQSNRSFRHNETFLQMQKALGARAIAHLYLHPTRLAEVLALFGDAKNGLQRFSMLGEWLGFDIEVKDKNLLLSGFLIGTPTQSRMDNLLKGVTPSESQIQEVCPMRTRFMLAYQVRGSEVRFLSNVVIAENQTSPLFETLMGCLDGEIALIHCESGDSIGVEPFLVLKTHSQAKALTEMSRLLNDTIRSVEPVGFVSSELVANIPIYQGFSGDEMTAAMRGLFDGAPGEFYTIYNNYLIFGVSVASLQRFVVDNLRDMTLLKDAAFREFMNRFPASQNIMCYMAPGYIRQWVAPCLNERGRLFASDYAALQRFNAFAVQLSSGVGPVYVNAALRVGSESAKDTGVIWQRKFDVPLVGKPQVVVNHLTGRHELLVQDADSWLYLLNGDGMVLWKKQLDGLIMGDVGQVDCFHNKKLQYVFNTASSLYLMDRNGNDLPHFPILLTSPAVQPVAVVDYEKTHDYRFFITGADGTIGLYNHQGNRIADWVLTRTENPSVSVPQHFDVGGKDYWVLADKSRHYLLDRRGNQRVQLSDEFDQMPSMPFVYAIQGGKHELLTFGSDGQLASIALPSGGVSRMAVALQSRPAAMKPLPGRQGLMAVVDSLYLYLIDGRGQVHWQSEPGSPLRPVVEIYPLADDDVRIGVVGANGNVYLYRSDGFLCNGFPKNGITSLAIGRLNANGDRLGVVVGGCEGRLLHYPLDTVSYSSSKK